MELDFRSFHATGLREIEAKPEIYFITDHYRGYPAVLARLAKLPAAEARVRLEQSFRIKAPAALVRSIERDTGA